MQKTLEQAKGDCAILLHADLQNPPEVIPQFIEAWETGAQIVQGVKNKSKESSVLFFFRTLFYWLMNIVFGIKIKKHATDFQLFDISFIKTLQNIQDNHPFLRGLILEYSTKIEYVSYTQDKRNKGKTKFNIDKYYDFAINGVISSSDRLPRKIIALSLIELILLAVESFFFFICNYNLLSSIQILISILIHFIIASFFIWKAIVAIIFEFIIGISKNSSKKPFIVEEKRIHY